MAYHMLRLSVGDDAFRKGIARFYRDFKGKRASFADFQKTMEAASGRDFTRFFADWIGRPGAPVLAVAVTSWSAGSRRDAGPGSSSKGVLRQTQGGAAVRGGRAGRRADGRRASCGRSCTWTAPSRPFVDRAWPTRR